MKPATTRVKVVQMTVQPGRPAENTARMLAQIADGIRDRADIVVFPEMAIPGYLIGDGWEHEAFLRECEACADDIRKASRGIVTIFGSVGVDWKRRNEDGRVRKYNALFVVENRKFRGPSGSPYPFVVKTLLPNYREFDDSRHFFDLRKLALEVGQPIERLIAPVQAAGLSLGCFLCEDAWDVDYAVSPVRSLTRAKPDLFINISSSPFTLNKNHKRNRVYSGHATRTRTPFVYVNNVGIQNNGKTVFTFDGSSCIYDGHGHAVPCAEPFAEGTLTFDVPLDRRATFGPPVVLADDGIGRMFEALRYGTEQFMALCGVQRVVVGISGGIDSAVVAALYRQILGPENLLLVNMPSRYNSSTTRSLAKRLAQNLGALYAEIAIEASVRLTQEQLARLRVASVDGSIRQRLALTPFMMENVQARDRSARILSAVAAAFDGVFTCNSNKSEATVGYATFYGDLAGYFANIADLWKTDVYALGHHLNNTVYDRPVIPQGIFDVTPSAELSPAQDVDQDKGDPIIYPYHDCLFRSWVETWNRTTPEEILEWYAKGTLEKKIGFDGKVAKWFRTPTAFVADLERWWNLYAGMAVAKRIQAPPVLAVKRRAFGFDHRESQMGPVYTRRYLELRKRLLRK